jgi:hypothetical protein
MIKALVMAHFRTLTLKSIVMQDLVPRLFRIKNICVPSCSARSHHVRLIKYKETKDTDKVECIAIPSGAAGFTRTYFPVAALASLDNSISFNWIG